MNQKENSHVQRQSHRTILIKSNVRVGLVPLVILKSVHRTEASSGSHCAPEDTLRFHSATDDFQLLLPLLVTVIMSPAAPVVALKTRLNLVIFVYTPSPLEDGG